MHSFLAQFKHLNIRVSALFTVFGLLAILNFWIVRTEFFRIKALEDQEKELLVLEGLPAQLVLEYGSAEMAALLSGKFTEAENRLKTASFGGEERDRKKLLTILKEMRLMAANFESPVLQANWNHQLGAYQVHFSNLKEQLDARQEQEATRFNFILLALLLLNFIGLGVGYSLFRFVVIRPLDHIARVSQNITSGKEQEKLPYEQEDEIGFTAMAINALIDDLQHARNFVVAIGKGELATAYEGVTENKAQDPNSLAGALLNMQRQMQTLAEKEKQRNWMNEGITRFTELIRQEQGNLQQLGDQVLRKLSAFLNVNQLGLYIKEKEGEEACLRLKACYAYNRKKYLNQTILVGEGLVGQVALDKETIYLTEIPADFANIKSGLGGAAPTAVVMVPLLGNEQLQGVLEVASLQEFKSHEIAFLERTASILGATILSERTSEENKKLLQDSQLMMEEMRNQEEEMRQNMEEMMAVQEDLSRSVKQENDLRSELVARMAALDSAALLTESDLYGNITFVNQKFCEVARYRPEEVLGKSHNILRHPDNPKSLFKDMWQTLKAGEVFKGRFPNLAKDGSTYWVESTIVPVLNEDRKPVKYIAVRFDVSKQVQKEQEFQELLSKIKISENACMN